VDFDLLAPPVVLAPLNFGFARLYPPAFGVYLRILLGAVSILSGLSVVVSVLVPYYLYFSRIRSPIP